MRIAIDLDGVAYDFVGHVIAHLYSKHNITLSRSDFTPKLSTLTQDPVANADLLARLDDGKWFSQIPLIPESVHAVSRLHQAGHDIIAMTSRHMSVSAATRAMVGRDFNGLIQEVHFTTNKPKLSSRLKVRHFAEDHPDIARRIADNRIHVWLIRSPYTGTPARTRFIRVVAGLEEMADRILTPIEGESDNGRSDPEFIDH